MMILLKCMQEKWLLWDKYILIQIMLVFIILIIKTIQTWRQNTDMHNNNRFQTIQYFVSFQSY